MIYLLTASGLPPGGSCTIHIYTQTIHRTTQNKQYIEQHKNFENNTNFGTVRAVPRLGELYHGICLTTEEKGVSSNEHIKLTLILKIQLPSPFLGCHMSRDISVRYLEHDITSAFLQSNNHPTCTSRRLRYCRVTAVFYPTFDLK